MIYRVALSEQAKQDLYAIYEYVAFTLLEPEIAKNLKNKIVDALKSLREMPCIYPIYQEEPLSFIVSSFWLGVLAI
jgi:toxin ParE1/3/4